MYWSLNRNTKGHHLNEGSQSSVVIINLGGDTTGPLQHANPEIPLRITGAEEKIPSQKLYGDVLIQQSVMPMSFLGREKPAILQVGDGEGVVEIYHQAFVEPESVEDGHDGSLADYHLAIPN
jgi:hypothetical protein